MLDPKETAKNSERVHLGVESISPAVRQIKKSGERVSHKKLVDANIDHEAHKKELVRLHKTQKMLAGKLQYKDEFITLLAHEVRNMLTPIMHSTEILKLMHRNDGECAELIHTIERQAKNISLILKNLRDESRATRGKIQLDMQPIDIKTVLEHAICAVKHLSADSENTITVTWLPVQIEIMGDTLRLEQVFINLLSNAIKYSPRGSEIVVKVFQETEHVLVAIADSGIGISPEALPHIFNLFMQSQEWRKQGQGGLGVGLTISRTLTMLHGGTLTAQSDGLGKGSVFTVRLPFIGCPTGLTTTNKSAPEEPMLPLPIKRVLIIDDNEKLLGIFKKLLQALQQDVRAAHTVEQALLAVKEHAPEVVFMDLSMPEMDGFELVKKLKEIPSLAQTYFVAVTGLSDKKAVQKCFASGFDQHLLKPISLEDIRAVLCKNR